MLPEVVDSNTSRAGPRYVCRALTFGDLSLSRRYSVVAGAIFQGELV